jgi:hypothetical protein
MTLYVLACTYSGVASGCQVRATYRLQGTCSSQTQATCTTQSPTHTTGAWVSWSLGLLVSWALSIDSRIKEYDCVSLEAGAHRATGNPRPLAPTDLLEFMFDQSAWPLQVARQIRPRNPCVTAGLNSALSDSIPMDPLASSLSLSPLALFVSVNVVSALGSWACPVSLRTMFPALYLLLFYYPPSLSLRPFLAV